MPFQNQVGVQPAPAVAGDFCDANPRYTLDAGPGGLVAGNALYVGRFCWTTSPLDGDNAPAVANSYGSGPVAGFVHRSQQGIFTQYLQETTMQIAAGFQVGDVFSAGGFWVVNDGSGQAIIGQKAYANFSNGKVTFNATGTPTTGASASSTAITAGTNSFTASISGNVMTVTAVASGVLYNGTVLTGAATGTAIVSQATSTAALGALGGTGTYYVSIPEQTVASGAFTGTYGLLTVGTVITAGFGVGNVLTGSAGATVTSGTTITQLVTGAGGAGTYIVTPTQSSSSGTISVTASNVETGFFARSSAAPGELVKISALPAY